MRCPSNSFVLEVDATLHVAVTSFRFSTPTSPGPLLKWAFFGSTPNVGEQLLSDASELLLFHYAAGDTTDHFVGLVAQFAESGWLK